MGASTDQDHFSFVLLFDHLLLEFGPEQRVGSLFRIFSLEGFAVTFEIDLGVISAEEEGIYESNL